MIDDFKEPKPAYLRNYCELQGVLFGATVNIIV